MTLLAWCALFAGWSLLALWVLRWGGADWLEGWKSLPFIDSWGTRWDAAQVKLYFLCLWLVYAVWFIAGLLVPQWRGLP